MNPIVTSFILKWHPVKGERIFLNVNSFDSIGNPKTWSIYQGEHWCLSSYDLKFHLEPQEPSDKYCKEFRFSSCEEAIQFYNEKYK